MSEHTPGLPVTVHGHPNADTLLLWTPAVAEDSWVAALAKRIAGRGKRVVVPTWRDGRDLLRSVRYARESAVHPPDQVTIAGYDAAGVAALSLALHQRRLGIGLAGVTCVAAGPGMADPISGQALPATLPAPATETTVTLVPGDEPASVAWTEQAAAAWREAGWPVELGDIAAWRG